MNSEELGRRIREIRLGLDMTQQEAASLAGIQQTRWSEYERGQHSPTVTRLQQIATALGVSPRTLLLPCRKSDII